MQWKTIQNSERTGIRIPKRWLHIHYYEALNILFRFENSLRVFVYIVLKMEKGCDWVETFVSSPGGAGGTIKSLSAKRISQADNFGYIGYDVKAPLMHMTSGELVDLIVADAQWPIFKRYFRGNKDIIKNKLLEIGTIRNSLAHFRPFRSKTLSLLNRTAATL